MGKLSEAGFRVGFVKTAATLDPKTWPLLGAGIGGLGGGALGYFLGGPFESSLGNMLLGAGVGAPVGFGAGLGLKHFNQAKQLQDRPEQPGEVEAPEVPVSTRPEMEYLDENTKAQLVQSTKDYNYSGPGSSYETRLPMKYLHEAVSLGYTRPRIVHGEGLDSYTEQPHMYVKHPETYNSLYFTYPQGLISRHLANAFNMVTANPFMGLKNLIWPEVRYDDY